MKKNKTLKKATNQVWNKTKKRKGKKQRKLPKDVFSLTDLAWGK